MDMYRGKLWQQLIAFVLLALPGSMAYADPIRIVALGDSLVHGYGLEPDQGFVPQMQRWLDAEGVEVELINAGLSGDTTSGGLARLDWALGDDADALIVELGGNDILRAISPDLARSNLERILQVAQDRNLPALLIGIVVPRILGQPIRKSSLPFTRSCRNSSRRSTILTSWGFLRKAATGLPLMRRGSRAMGCIQTRMVSP